MNDNFDYVDFVNKNRIGQYIKNTKATTELNEVGTINTRDVFDIIKPDGERIEGVKFFPNGSWYIDTAKGGRHLYPELPYNARVEKSTRTVATSKQNDDTSFDVTYDNNTGRNVAVSDDEWETLGQGGLKEAGSVNPEMDERVKDFLTDIAGDIDITEEQAARAVVAAIKRLGHKF